MEIGQAIERCDALKPNQYSKDDKVQWLSELDLRIFLELIKTHENPAVTEFTGYSNETEDDTELLIPEPYSEIYIHLLSSKIDFYNAEYTRYNNTAALFNARYREYADYYNRTHMPLQNNSIRI